MTAYFLFLEVSFHMENKKSGVLSHKHKKTKKCAVIIYVTVTWKYSSQ